MPNLLFISVASTEEVLAKDGRVRFPGNDKAIEELSAAGWEVSNIPPTWPAALETAKEQKPDAILVSCFKAVPRSRDAASMLARMQDAPVYVVGVLQKDEAFRTMAPEVGVLKQIGDLPKPE